MATQGAAAEISESLVVLDKSASPDRVPQLGFVCVAFRLIRPDKGLESVSCAVGKLGLPRSGAAGWDGSENLAQTMLGLAARPMGLLHAPDAAEFGRVASANGLLENHRHLANILGAMVVPLARELTGSRSATGSFSLRSGEMAYALSYKPPQDAQAVLHSMQAKL